MELAAVAGEAAPMCQVRVGIHTDGQFVEAVFGKKCMIGGT
ncbi:hypothetical protein [Microbispora bryophytorum]